MWDFVMDRSGAGAGFLLELRFVSPAQSTFHLLLHNNLHYNPRLAQWARSGRSANSLTNQIIIIIIIKTLAFRRSLLSLPCLSIRLIYITPW
jgi:hypothetical protein